MPLFHGPLFPSASEIGALLDVESDEAAGLEGLMNRVDKRFDELVHRRDDKQVIQLLTVAFNDVLTDPEPRWLELWLAGVTVELPRELSEQIELTPDENEYCTTIGNGYFGPDALLRHRLTQQIDRAQAQSELESMLDLIRVALTAPAVVTHTMVSGQQDVAEVSARRGSWLPPRILTPEDAKNVADRWPRWRRRDTSLDHVLEAFKEGLFATTPVKTIAWSVAAIESLLVPSDTSEPARDVVVREAPRAAETAVSRQKYWVDALQAAYKLRNDTFHPKAQEVTREGFSRLRRRTGRSEEEFAVELLGLASRLVLQEVTDSA